MLLELRELLLPTPPALADRPLLLAYSGGLDSTVLLDALTRLQRPLRVAHIHHGLQAVAEDWVEHCAAECDRRGVPFHLLRVRIDARDPAGPEAAARQARYAALRGLLAPGEVLVTAHHADDQAETFLMRALRGAGPRGLAAMRALQPFEPGWLWRPLLHRHRVDLAKYASAQQLNWIEDPHNADARYERSWLRNEVLPILRGRWPAASQSLARSAALCAEAEELQGDLALLDAASALRGAVLSVTAIKQLSPARRNNLLRWWITGPRKLSLPPYALLAQINDLLEARVDAEPCMRWPGGELRRYRDELHALAPLPPVPEAFDRHWDGRDTLALPDGCGFLTAESPGAPRQLSVRLPRGGERLVVAAGRPSRTLKNLFQEQAIPPWRRPRTPLVFEAGVLRWVGGLDLPVGSDAFYAALRWSIDDDRSEAPALFL